MVIIDALPIEIIRRILEVAFEKERTTSAKGRWNYTSLSEYREQQALIRKLGSVCHRWRSICLEFLFENVWIASPLGPNILVFRQIFDTATLCRYSRNPPGWWTRQLTLDIVFLEPPERKALINHLRINNSFPNVDRLSIFNCEDEENGKLILDLYAMRLTFLTLSGPKDTFGDMIAHAPGALSQLQELSLHFSSKSHESTPTQEQKPLVLPSVHTLYLRKAKQDEYLALLDWSFPSLRTLTISGTYSFPDAFAPFMHLHGSNLTSLSLPYWPSWDSVHNDLFEACRALERLEVLGARWEGEDDIRQPVPVSLSYYPVMEEHRLQEWIFRPFWVDCDFDESFEDYTADPELFPALQKIRLLSPGVDKIFSVSLRKVQSLKDWSRALKLRGVSLVDDEDGISIFLSTICVGGGTDWRSSSLFQIILYFLYLLGGKPLHARCSKHSSDQGHIHA